MAQRPLLFEVPKHLLSLSMPSKVVQIRNSLNSTALEMRGRVVDPQKAYFAFLFILVPRIQFKAISQTNAGTEHWRNERFDFCVSICENFSALPTITSCQATERTSTSGVKVCLKRGGHSHWLGMSPGANTLLRLHCQ